MEISTYRHKRGECIVTVCEGGKTIAISKEAFDENYDADYIGVKNVTVIDDSIHIEAEPFSQFDGGSKVKNVSGFEERFLVTDNGDVLSRTTNSIMSTSLNHNGYVTFATYVGGREGQPHCFRVHRLVAEAFIPNPDKKPQVNHLDGEKTNNHYTNLEWVTNRENAIHAFENGLTKAACGVHASSAKLTAADVRDIRRRIAEGDTMRSIANTFGIAHTGVIDIKFNRTYRSVA